LDDGVRHRHIDALAPTTDRAALDSQFALIREAREWLRSGRELGFGGLADPQTWLDRLEGVGTVLDPREFLDAATLLDTAAWLKPQFKEDAAKFPLLAARAASLADFRDLLAAIRRAILPNAEISDDASPALRRIRASVSETRTAIQKTLRQILRARNAEASEDYVTLRNDRFVIPVRAEQRRSVPGVMHGASATGQTVFLEPLETVESNNQLVQLAEEEAAEIVRILRSLTERLQSMHAPLAAAAETIAEFDSAFARARFAQDFDATTPEFSDSNELRLDAARHPVLENKLRRENRPIVPMSLNLGGEERLLVISGPNTGGKTVTLKTTALLAMMAQAGLPIPALAAGFPVFTAFLADIGDAQSIEAALSTFSAHITNLDRLARLTDRRSLVLLDELGSATDPEEGSALAVAIASYFLNAGAWSLISTHHTSLKVYAANTPGVLNAAGRGG